MSKQWFWIRALVMLIIIGLLAGGGLALYRAGWSQGYVAGQLAAEGEAVMPMPYLPYSFGYVGRPLGFAPFLLGAGLFFLLLGVIGKLLHFVLWGPAWRFGMVGPRFERGAGWHRAARWQRMHGPMPPWCWGWEEPHEEQPGEVEPEADTGKAGA